MADEVVLTPINFEELRQAIGEFPELVFLYCQRRLRAWSSTFRSRFIRQRLRGRPGIQWDEGNKAIGGNVRTSVEGTTLADLRARIQISRFLTWHERGVTVRAPEGRWLYIRSHPGRGRMGQVFARVKEVQVPARLGFVELAEQEIPKEGPRLARAAARAMNDGLRRRLRAIHELHATVANL